MTTACNLKFQHILRTFNASKWEMSDEPYVCPLSVLFVIRYGRFFKKKFAERKMYYSFEDSFVLSYFPYLKQKEW